MKINVENYVGLIQPERTRKIREQGEESGIILNEKEIKALNLLIIFFIKSADLKHTTLEVVEKKIGEHKERQVVITINLGIIKLTVDPYAPTAPAPHSFAPVMGLHENLLKNVQYLLKMLLRHLVPSVLF